MLKFAIKDFLDDRKFKNVSPFTLVDYERELQQFHNFIADNGKVNVEDITPSDIKAFFMHCKEKLNNSPVTINHKLINIKAFFNYMVQEKVITENPVTVQKQKVDVKIEAFTDYHVQQMLRYYRKLKQRDKSFYSYRDYLIIVMLLGTGVRRGELCNIRWRDIDLLNAKLTVIGKGRRQRTIPLTDKLKQELVEWQLFVKKRFGSLSDDDYVFVTTTKKRLTENAVENVFKRLQKIMNFKDVRLSCHTFRHTFAKNWIMAGGDVFTLQRILGHSTLEMTNKYVSLFGSAIKEQNDKYNPLNSMEV